MYNYAGVDRGDGSFDWNRVVGIRWDDQYQYQSMIPSRGYYRFKSIYKEVPQDLDTAIGAAGQSSSVFLGDKNFFLAPGTVGVADSYVITNSLKPFLAFGTAPHLLAPWGSAFFASLYGKYRVTSIDMDMFFRIDESTLTSGSAFTAAEFILGFGCYLWGDGAGNEPTTESIKQMVLHGDLPLAILKKTGSMPSTMNNVAHVKLRNLNILKQFVQENTVEDINDVTDFAGEFGDGAFANIIQPAFNVYCTPFYYIIKPMAGQHTLTEDTQVRILTEINIISHTELVDPQVKSPET